MLEQFQPDPTVHRWGFHKEIKWVVLDRTLACNKSGYFSEFWSYIRCDSWSFFLHKREHKFDFEYAPNYLQRLPQTEFEVANSAWIELIHQFKTKSQELHHQAEEKQRQAIEEQKRLSRELWHECVKQKHRALLLKMGWKGTINVGPSSEEETDTRIVGIALVLCGVP